MRYSGRNICPSPSGRAPSNQTVAETNSSTLANVPIGSLSFVMIMEASSELLHHESSAKGASPSALHHKLFVTFPRVEHNSKLFGTLSLIPGAVKSQNISVFPPSYALLSLADESIIIPTHTPKSSFAIPS